MSWQALRDQLASTIPGLAVTIVGSTLIGGGVQVAANTITLVRVEDRVGRLEQLDGKIDELSDELVRTRIELARSGRERG